MPNGTTIRSTHRGSLKLDSIPPEARKAFTFRDLNQWSLLSLGQLCDAGMKAILDKHSVSITLGDDIVLSGYRNESTNGVWMIDFTKPQSACNVYPTGTLAKLVQFYHGCFCSLTLASFKKLFRLGVKLPGISIKDVDKYPPNSAATAAGHLDGTRWRRIKHNLKLESLEHEGSEGDEPPEEIIHPREETVLVT